MREISACFESGRFTQAIRAIIEKKLDFRLEVFDSFLRKKEESQNYLALSLFMFWFLADNTYHTLSSDDDTLITDFFD